MSFHRWFAGFFLLILMITALFLNTAMFSARSFQHHLITIDRNSGGVAVLADIEKVRTQITELENQRKPLMGEAQQAELKMAERQRAVDEAREALQREQIKILASTSALEDAAGVAPPAESAGAAFDADLILQRIASVEGNRAQASATRDGTAAVRTALSDVTRREAELGPKEDELVRAQNELRLISEQLNGSQSQILGLKASYGENFDRIYNEAKALKRSSFLGMTETFAAMHPTFVSTILAIVMGALGAILYLFPAYLNPANQITFVVIIVRLFFGMVAALAFYIVANVTGVALTSGNGGVTMGGDLNPFMVAFLGIIAGIMADDIAKWLMARGREILGGAEGGTPPAGGAVNPRGGPEDPAAMGLIGDPFAAAARDAARTTMGAGDPGDQPPRGRILRSGEG